MPPYKYAIIRAYKYASIKVCMYAIMQEYRYVSYVYAIMYVYSRFTSIGVSTLQV